MKQKIYFEAKAKKSKSPIEKVIKNLGINYPNESLGFLHAVYAKVDGKTPNKNRVILAKTVKKDVPQLCFTQANINHKRQGYVIGTILDAWVNQNDQIEIVFSFFKSLYPKEWEIVENAIAEDEMSVSFELMVKEDDIINLVNGVRKLKRVSFDGVGLLFPGVSPAYDDAKVLQSANAIINNVFDNKKTLVCASAKDAVDKIEEYLLKFSKKKKLEEASYKCECIKCGNVISSTEHCKDIKCSKCGSEMRRFDRPSKQNYNAILKDYKKIKGEIEMEKKTRDALLAKFKEELIKELGEEAVKDWSDEQWEAELEKRASAEQKTESETTEASDSEAEESKDKEVESSEEKKKEETKEISKEDDKAEETEEKSNEDSKEDKKEEKAGKSKVVTEEKMKTETTYDDETKIETISRDGERIVKRDGKEVYRTKIKEDQIYNYAQVEDMKAKYEEKLKSKDKEIDFLKENAKKVVEIRAELGDFVKDLSDEDLLDENKLENARLKKRVNELEKKELETAEDKDEDDDKNLKIDDAENKEEKEESADDRIGNYLKNKYGK